MGCMSTLPHTPGYSRRSHEIAPFHVMSLLARAQALEQAGHDVIHLEIGEPDFTTAEPVVRAGQAAWPPAIPATPPHAACRPCARRSAASIAATMGWTSTPNASWSPRRLRCAAAGQQPAGRSRRHWLLADPGYPCNRHFLRLVEGGAQLVPVGPDTAYQLTRRWWNSTGMPTASARWWPRRPTDRHRAVRRRTGGLSQTLHARGGHLVVDEIYHGLTYGLDAPSVLQVDDSAFVLNSFPSTSA
jgi:aspartate/methionine/tyrosine aminotransferase